MILLFKELFFYFLKNMEEELSFEEKYKRLDPYKVLLDEPEMLLRYVTYGTYLNLLGTPEVFELIMTKIKYDWYDMVNEWIKRMNEGETIQIENQRIPIKVLHNVFDYIDSVIQVYTNVMNPMEEESNQGSFDYLTFQRFWSLYNVTLYEMVLQLKKVDAILKEMEQELQQEGESDIRIEETRPTLNEIDMTNEIKPIPKKKQKVECEDISDKNKPRDPSDKPKKRSLTQRFENQNKKKSPGKASEMEEIVIDSVMEVLEEKDKKNEPLDKNDKKRIKVKAAEKLVQKIQDKLDGKLPSKKPESKKKEKKEKKEKPQKKTVPETEKRDEPQPKPATVTNPLDAIRAAGLLSEENMDRMKEEQIKQEKFEKKEIDLTDPIEEINIKDELARKNKKSEKQKDVGKPILPDKLRKRKEERKIKQQKENKLLDKDKQKVLQLIKKKEFIKNIPKSDDLKEILKNHLRNHPELILSLKVEELQKPVTEWILVDTPQEYLKDIIYSNDNKGYIVLGKKSVQVSMRYIDEIRKSICNTMITTMQEMMKEPGYENNKGLQNTLIIINNWIRQQLPKLTFDYILDNLDYKMDMTNRTMAIDGTLLYVRLGTGVNLKIDFK